MQSMVKRVYFRIKQFFINVVFRGRLLNIGQFLEELTTIRICNIQGFQGKGKTLLAVALWFELWENNLIERCFAPIPIHGQCFDETEGTKFVMILDEAHVWLGNRDYATNDTMPWLRDLRRRESILILPRRLHRM